MRALRLPVGVVVLLCGLTLDGPTTALAQVNPREALTATPAWLAAHLNDPALVLLHVGDADEYVTRHIPGARLASLADLSAPDRGGGGPSLELPSAQQLHRTLQSLGISNQSTIVVYYAKDWYAPATRIVFTLTAGGLGARTRLLEGGLPAWSREGHPIATQKPTPKPGTLSRLSILPLVVDAAFLQANASKPGIAVVDARAQATALLFVARTLGHQVLLYDGSMEDWVKRNLPLEMSKGGVR